jgi:hypothetical protein
MIHSKPVASRCFGAFAKATACLLLGTSLNALVHATTSQGSTTGDAKQPLAFSTHPNPDLVGIRVFPSLAGPGVRRFLIPYGSPYGRSTDFACGISQFVHSFDRSRLVSDSLIVLRQLVELRGCAFPSVGSPPVASLQSPVLAYGFEPSGAGNVRFQWSQQIGSTVYPYLNSGPPKVNEVMIATAPERIRSTANVSGMWFDPATNGSGMALHHNSSTDAAFGTLFLFSDAGVPRWFTMQYVYWVNGGNSLEGLLLPQATGRCANGTLVACAATGRTASWYMFGSKSLTEPLPDPPVVGDYSGAYRPERFEADHFVRMDFLAGDLVRVQISNETGDVVYGATLTRLRH